MKKPRISNAKVEAVSAIHASMQRLRMLAACGLQECENCKSWIISTRAAESFHFRRCSG